jgi:hypothetical protein
MRRRKQCLTFLAVLSMSRRENAGGNQGGGRFRPGQSGNPTGKPKGTRNRTTLAMEALLDGEAEAITRKAIDLAKAGDMAAVRLCFDRLYPPRRDRHIQFEIPPLNSAADASQAAAAIVEGVATGSLTPSEAGELSRVVSAYATTLEAADFDARLRKLEAARK